VDSLPALVLLGAGAELVVPVNLGTITDITIITRITTTRQITPYLMYFLVWSSRFNSLGFSLIDFI